MLKVVFVALLPLAVSALLDLREISIYRRQDDNSTLDACIDNCVTDAAIEASCSESDITGCICSNTQFQTDTITCLTANCTATDVSEVAQAFSQGCASLASQSVFGSPTGSQTQTASGTLTGTSTGHGGAATTSSGGGSSTNVAVIAGAAGGGGAALLLIIAGIFTCVYCRKKKQRGPQYLDTPATQDVAARPLAFTQPSFAPTVASAATFDPTAGNGFAPHSPNNFDMQPGTFVTSTSTFDSHPGGFVSPPTAYPAVMSIEPVRSPTASTAFTGAYSSSNGPSVRPPSAGTGYTAASPMPSFHTTTPSPGPPQAAMPMSFAAPIAVPAAAAYSDGPSSSSPPQRYTPASATSPPAFAAGARDAHGYPVDSKQSRGQTVLAATPGVTIPLELLDRLNPSQRGIVEGLLVRGDVGSDAVVDVVRRMLAENEAQAHDDEASGLPSYGA